MAHSYATLQDFYTHGLPPAACVAESRAIKTITLATSTFEVANHGLSSGSLLKFEGIGSVFVLPAPLSGLSYYKIVVLSADHFKVTDLSDAPVVLTTVGSGVIHIVEDITAKIEMLLKASSSYLDAHTKAYKPPFQQPYPLWATQVVCHLAARDLCVAMRKTTPGYNLDDIKERGIRADAFLARLNRGTPTADNPADQSPTIREAGAVGWKATTVSGPWGGGDAL
jgi:hypothetical protein